MAETQVVSRHRNACDGVVEPMALSASLVRMGFFMASRAYAGLRKMERSVIGRVSDALVARSARDAFQNVRAVLERMVVGGVKSENGGACS